MLLCEHTAVVLDMVRPKAQLALTACESEWGPGPGVSTGRGCPFSPWTAGLETDPENSQGADLPHLPEPRLAVRQAPGEAEG